MIDKGRIKQRFSASALSYDQQAIAQQAIYQRLMALLAQVEQSRFQRVLEIGCGTGGLTQRLMAYLQVEHWELNDLCDMQPYLQQRLSQPFHFHCGDAEKFPFKQQYDLIVSASALQWFENPKGFVENCKKQLKGQGYLLLSTFTQDNLKQIKQLTGVGLNYPSEADWRNWLQPEFEILALEQQEIVLCFENPMAVLAHLKQTGVTATQQQGWTKGRLQQFVQEYAKQYANSAQKVELTYAPLYVFARLK